MLFEIINNSDLHLDLQVFEKDVRKIEMGQKVIFAYVNSGQVSKQDTATIFAIDKEFDPQTQALTVHAHIENYKGIMLPGMYVNARVIIDKDNELSVPDDAIVSQGDEHFIFVSEKPGDENTFRKITVSIGSSDLGYTAIIPTEKLSDSVRVVIKGAYAIFSAMNIGGDEE
jgi:cobalt-zinc-cadmium efflux system membrane fusion protein